MRSRIWLIGLICVLCGVVAAPVLASVVRSASLEETIESSEAIVVGRILSQRPTRLDDGAILTRVRVRVEESLKGNMRPGIQFDLSTYGGEMEGGRAVTLGEAVYRRGERVLLQLERVDGRWHTLGLSMGKWSVAEDASGGRTLIRDLSGLGIVVGVRMSEGPIPLEDFRAQVRQRSR